jgi:hypothetical protein
MEIAALWKKCVNVIECDCKNCYTPLSLAATASYHIIAWLHFFPHCHIVTIIVSLYDRYSFLHIYLVNKLRTGLKTGAL